MALPTPVLAGNWKMHHGPAAARAFFDAFLRDYPETPGRTIAFFPPALSLAAARAATGARGDILLGVQNLYWEEKGAFTGEISAPMAAESGARLALVGHSERRHVFGETSEQTGRKVRAALDAGLLPVLCVGETLEEREAGRAERVVTGQLEAGLAELRGAPSDLLIAYEPVWAIGTGRNAAPEDAAEMHGRIREFLSERYGAEAARAVPILYGGSVKPENAASLLAAADIDGVLVGGASLDPAGFARICRTLA